jgi:hypothetical protein
MRSPSAPSHNSSARTGHHGRFSAVGGVESADKVNVSLKLKSELLAHVFKGFHGVFYLYCFKYVR